MFIYSRNKLNLSGMWRMEVDNYDAFEDRKFWEQMDVKDQPVDYSPESWRKINVPSCWNTERKELENYEGPAWYFKQFKTYRKPSFRYFLYFEAANYFTRVWLNGQFIGQNEGGYTPFYFEVTERLKNENTLIVKVDNTRKEDGIPSLVWDWFNFGGITRAVYLVAAPNTYIRNYKQSLSVSAGKATVRFELWVDGDEIPGSAKISIPEVNFVDAIMVSKNGYGMAEFDINPKLWSPENPKLYKIQLIYKKDRIFDLIGFRAVKVEDENILLNGNPIFLRGICLHEEVDGKGRTLDQRDVDQRFRWAKELNCNFFRLAHYPHTELMSRTADKLGFLLWEEIPIYWKIAFQKSENLEKAKYQIQKLMERDWNRASVILWSMSNETTRSTARNNFLFKLADFTKKLDPTRLVTSACYFTIKKNGSVVFDDPLGRKLDVIGINEYHGWYQGNVGEIESFRDDHRYRKPIIISETGAGARCGNHGLEKQRWTEEFQADYYRRQLAVLNSCPRVNGISPWILFDFRSPLRTNKWQKGYNRKGLIDNRGREKLAFHTLSSFYAKKSKEK